jgi:hypothetical protein
MSRVQSREEPARSVSMSGAGRLVGAVCLAVFSNFVYDALIQGGGSSDIELLGYYALLIGLSVGLVLILKSVSTMASLEKIERPFPSTSRLRVFNSIVGAVGGGAVLGAMTTLVAVIPLFNEHPYVVGSAAFWNYEVGLFAMLLGGAALLSHRQTDWVAQASFSVAFGLSVASVLELVKGEANNFFETGVNWTSGAVLATIAALALRLGPVGEYIRRGFRELTRAR